MKKNKIIENNIKTMSGNVLAIGLDDSKLIDALDKNNNITICNLLNSNTSTGEGNGKTKKILITKLRKKFKKKKVNYLICNYNEVEPHLKTFVKDSIYITNGIIYYYLDECSLKKQLIKKYSRYDVKIEDLECSDGNVLVINVKNAKNNKYKELLYSIIDTITKIIDDMTNMLLS